MNKDRCFTLEDKKIILYGAASIGSLAIAYFEEHGYDVYCYIDKRGHEICTFVGKPVYELEDSDIKALDKESVVVFVSVKNVFEHTNIARKLIDNGFNNIIYRPLSVINGGGTVEEKALYDIYGLIETGKVKDCESIPTTERIGTEIKTDNYVIKNDDGDRCVIIVPVNQVYTDNKPSPTPWFDIPVLSFLPHIDLFRYISGEKGVSYQRYLDFCIFSANNSNTIKVTDAWKSNVLKNRSDVYEHMSKSYELDREFFIRNAPKAEWNEKRAVFNLNSGKHRAAFHAALRKKYIALSVTKEDYAKYLNARVTEKLKNKLSAGNLSSFKAPIDHIAFFDCLCSSTEFYYNFLYALFYDISEDIYASTERLDFDKYSVICDFADDGFIGRAFYKAGFNMYKAEDMKEDSLVPLLDELFYTKLSTLSGVDGQKEMYDYAVIDLRNKETDNASVRNIMDRTKNVYAIIGDSLAADKYISSGDRNWEKFYSSICDGVDTVVLKKTVNG